MKKYISSFIQPYLAFAASACSIIGLAVVIVSDKDATIIALITLCMCLFFILIGILLAIDRLLRQNYRKDYKSISSFYVYQSDDGVKSTFECFRLIQCKRMFLSQIVTLLRQGETKDEMYKELGLVFNGCRKEWNWQEENGILSYLLRAWDAFYRAFDFTSAIHNAMKMNGDRHLMGLLLVL